MGIQVFQTPKVGIQVFQTPKVGIQVFQTPMVGIQVFQTPKVGIQVFQTPKVGIQVFQTPKVEIQVFQTPKVGIQVFQTPKVGIQVFQTPKVGIQVYSKLQRWEYKYIPNTKGGNTSIPKFALFSCRDSLNGSVAAAHTRRKTPEIALRFEGEAFGMPFQVPGHSKGNAAFCPGIL